MKPIIIVLSLVWTAGMAIAEESVVKEPVVATKKATNSVLSNPKTAVINQEPVPAMVKKAVLKTEVSNATQTKASTVSMQKVSAKKNKAPLAPALSSALKKANYQTTGDSSMKSRRGTTGFFSLSFQPEALPLKYLEYYDTSVNFAYGGYFNEQNGFTAGVRANMRDGLFIMLKYNYDFITGSKWIPGMDISLLVGSYNHARYKKYNREAKPKSWIDAGLEIGPYIKTFISRSHALVLRTGLAYDTSQLMVPNLSDIRLYLSLGIQWHF